MCHFQFNFISLVGGAALLNEMKGTFTQSSTPRTSESCLPSPKSRCTLLPLGRPLVHLTMKLIMSWSDGIYTIHYGSKVGYSENRVDAGLGLMNLSSFEDFSHENSLEIGQCWK